MRAVVAQRHAVVDRRRARGARQIGAHDDRVEVDVVDLAQVDLAQQAAVVPPAARRRAHGRQARGREVGLLAPRIDPDDQVIDAAALEQAGGQADLEGEVGAAVLADRLAVEPDLRAVVDRLEAHHPRRRLGRGGQPEVLAIPADAAEERLRAVVAHVPGVGDRDLLPAGDPRLELRAALVVVELEQPRAVHEVAPRGTGLVERLGARRGDDGLRARGCGGGQEDGEGDDGGGDGETHAEAAEHGWTPDVAAGARACQHEPVELIGTLRRRRLIARPVSTLPVRCTSTHCTTGSWRLTIVHATRVGPLAPPSA